MKFFSLINGRRLRIEYSAPPGASPEITIAIFLEYLSSFLSTLFLIIVQITLLDVGNNWRKAQSRFIYKLYYSFLGIKTQAKTI